MEDADDDDDGCGRPRWRVATAEDTTINDIGDGKE
jgi:hypothetical protein